MSKIRRVDFSPDEFLSGVSNLKHDEIGPYWIACCLMYSRGGPIADDDVWIAKACGCHWRTWRAIKERLLAVGKLARTPEGELINGRTMTEIEAADGRIEQARKGGQKSGETRRLRGSGTPQDAVRNASGSSQDEPELFNSNGLGRTITNHQPPTKTVTTSSTEERGTTRAKRAPPPSTRKLTAEWTLSDELRQWTDGTLSATNAVGKVDVERELLKFRTYHVREGTTERGATRAWHTWIFNAIKWSEEDGSSISRQGGRQPQRRSPAATAAALAAGLSRLGDRGSGGEGDPQ